MNELSNEGRSAATHTGGILHSMVLKWVRVHTTFNVHKPCF